MPMNRPPTPPPDPEGMPAMLRVEGSSTVYAIGYADEAHMLFVRFRARGPGEAPLPGTLYRYVKVPRTVWTRLQRAGSAGQYLTDHVKGKYGYAQWTGQTWRPETVLRVLAAQRRRAQKRAR